MTITELSLSIYTQVATCAGATLAFSVVAMDNAVPEVPCIGVGGAEVIRCVDNK